MSNPIAPPVINREGGPNTGAGPSAVAREELETI
jgi:hypothetical protein